MSVYKEFSRDLSLSGKVAVVSGGTSGIGFATAKMLALKGAAVVIWGRNPNIRQMAREIGGDAYGVQVDITDTAQILSAVDDVIKMNGKIDILCNSAGIGSGKPAEDISEEEFMNVLNVNLKSAFMVAQSVGRTMIERGEGGRIINIASDAGIVAIKDHVAYSASKAGLLAVTRSLALEWGKYGITCNAISPCVVMTPMSRAYWVGERAERHLEQIPVGRFAEMDEIAAAVAFLASDGAQMINGHNLSIDGGFTIN
ncbi:MAG: D-threitol dehydrogenase [Firmicutes bacterium]|nr:D-threitol dehydrogenase [Bacillota bacterium]